MDVADGYNCDGVVQAVDWNRYHDGIVGFPGTWCIEVESVSRFINVDYVWLIAFRIWYDFHPLVMRTLIFPSYVFPLELQLHTVCWPIRIIIVYNITCATTI